MITSLYQSLCNMETNIADRVALRWYDEEKQGVADEGGEIRGNIMGRLSRKKDQA